MNKEQIQDLINLLVEEWVELDDKEPRDKIRYSGPCFGSEEYKAAISALLSGWWCGGGYTLKSEAKLAEISRRNHALLVNSGSSANLVGITALKEEGYLKEGDKVLSLSCCFPTTINPIIQNNLIPVLVDMDRELGLDPEVLEECIKEKKIKGVFYAHTLGFPGRIDEILDICRKYDIVCAFDCCDAYGSKYKGKPLQEYGKFATFSFYPAHHITAGGHGGAIVTNDPSFHTTSRGIARWGRYCASNQCCIRSLPNGRDLFCPTQKLSPDCGLPKDQPVSYQFEWMGYNLQINEIQAAILYEQMLKLPEFDNTRRKNYNILYEYFANNWSTCEFLPITEEISPFSFFFILPEGIQRNHLINHLKQDKIESKVLFGGMIQNHPAYTPLYCNDELRSSVVEEFGTFHQSRKVMERGLMLGVSQVLDETHMYKICESLERFNK